MTTGVIIVLGILGFIFGPRPIIFVLVSGLIGWLLCDINIEKEYTWFYGIWHGIFFLPNYVRHLVWDTPFKADLYTTGYNVWYWIVSISSTLGYITGGANGRRDYY